MTEFSDLPQSVNEQNPVEDWSKRVHNFGWHRRFHHYQEMKMELGPD